MAKGNQFSFLHVNKPEIDLKEDVDVYSDQVYQKGLENLDKFIANNWLIRDLSERFYIYSQTMSGKTQYGLVCASSVEDYENDVIKKHEKTIAKKELDRTKLTDTQSANVGPVFLTYKGGEGIQQKIDHIVKAQEPYSTVTSEDSITHTVSFSLFQYSLAVDCGSFGERFLHGGIC